MNKKSKILTLVAALIILAVFNVIAFAAPFTRAGTFWTGYAFTTLAVIIATAAIFYALDRAGLRSKFYGLPILYVAWSYLVAQVIAGLIFMMFPDIPRWVALVVSVILLAAALLGFIAVDLSRDEIERVDAKVREKVFYIKSLQSELENLAAQVSDPALKKSLIELAEAFRYSDPMSSPQLAALENQIAGQVAALAPAVAAENIAGALAQCGELQQLLAERNRKCKLLK
jgi:MFS family permease